MARGKFQPMLAYQETPETEKDIARLKFPMYYSHKLDGVRMTHYGNMVSRSNTPFPSAFVHHAYKGTTVDVGVDLLGVDGECIVGDPFGEGVFDRVSGTMRTHGSMVPIDWYVFDYCHPQWYHRPYEERKDKLADVVSCYRGPGKIVLLEQTLVRSWSEVLECEARSLSLGYEGGMIRSPINPYKFGRSTLIENGLIKIKRFETREAVIEGFYELMRNENAPELSRTGFQKRSSSINGLVGGGTLGGFHVKDLETGVRFNLGSGLGLDDALRLRVWQNQDKYQGRIVSYKKLMYGEKDKPRNCTFRGFRDKFDM